VTFQLVVRLFHDFAEVEFGLKQLHTASVQHTGSIYHIYLILFWCHIILLELMAVVIAISR